MKDVTLRGVGASPGVIRAPAFIIQNLENEILERKIEPEEVSREVQRLEEALEETRKQLTAIQKKMTEEVGPDSAAIFDAHLMVVDDPSFIDEVVRAVEDRLQNVDIVLHDVSNQYAQALDQMEDEYLRERAVDIRDVARRIGRNLIGHEANALVDVKEPAVIIASDLTPSDTALMDTSKIKALLIDHGSYTSHTAILARALEIPAIVGLHDASIRVPHGASVLVDGNKGVAVIEPTPDTIAIYQGVIESRKAIHEELDRLIHKPAEMLDGYRVMLSANLELPEEMPHVLSCGAHGIGLWRTEFLYLTRTELPDEESQFEIYNQVAEQMFPHPLIIRTLDLGGDKFAAHFKQESEMNPFLGWRAIRFCLEEREVFRIQLRAILRASVHENVHIMIPFISDVREILQVLDLIHEVKAELISEGIRIGENIPVGVMIEIPSAALTAGQIAPHVDFFSIGTNDLVQYTLAVDRNNERIAHLYNPAHQSVLQLIRMTIDAAHKHGIWTGICGEMAGDPVMVPLLIGMGADELSVNPGNVGMVKSVIRHLRYSQAEALAEEVRAIQDHEQVVAKCRDLVEKITPEVLELL